MNNEQVDVFGESDSIFEEDIAPKLVEHVSVELRTSFFPWHKPRKQFLRVEQWGKSIERLVETLDLKQLQKPLTYLSLPGPDLLDIRSIQPLCEKKEVNLSFLGINSGADDDPAASHLSAALLNQVRSMPFISKDSEVVPDKFEHLAKKKSIAHERVIKARKSFDVINIDLCGSLAKGPSGIKSPNIPNAVFGLLEHQATYRNQDWLLFLTTRSNKDEVDLGTMERFVTWINTAITKTPELIDKMQEQSLIDCQCIADGQIDLEKLEPPLFSNIFALGIGHWIVSSLIGNTPAWRVDMLPQYGYHVVMKDKSCDILSLGFYCKRIKTVNVDQFGIAHRANEPSPEPITITEQKCHEKVRLRVSENNDVDVTLYLNDEIYQTHLESSAKLLSSARYDEGKYKQWAEEEKGKINKFIEEFIKPDTPGNSSNVIN